MTTLLQRSLSALAPAISKAAAQGRLPQTMGIGTGWLGSPVASCMQAQMSMYGQVGWLFSVVSRIAESVAAPAWEFQTVHQTANGEELTPDPNHPLAKLWAQPHPFIDQNEFIEICQQHYELAGEMWWLLGRGKYGDQPIMELTPIRPDRMIVIPDRDEWIKGYVYRLGSEAIPLSVDDVIMVKHPNPLDPYRGLGVVAAIMSDLEGERYASTWNRNFFLNSAEPGGIIEFDRSLDDIEFEKLLLRWREQHQGVANAHRVAILERGKWVDRKYTQRDMQFEALRKVSRDTILGAFGVHGHLLGLTDQINRANADAAEYTFGKRIVDPRLRRWQGGLQRLSVKAKVLDHRWTYESPITEDRTQALAEATTGYTAGVLKRSEARARLGEASDTSDDVYISETLPAPVDPAKIAAGDEVKQITARIIERDEGDDPAPEADLWPEGGLAAEHTMRHAWTRRLHEQAVAIADHLDQFKAGGVPVIKLEESDLDSFDWDWWSQYAEAVQHELSSAFAAGYLGTAAEQHPTLAHQAAVHYARTRAGELLRMGGEDNVVSFTQYRVRQLVAETIQKGESLQTLRQRLMSDVAFSPSRAKSIANTETATALGQGSKQAAAATGRTEKRWFSAGDRQVCPICRANDNGNWIDGTKAFPQGQDTIPGHPGGCRCSVQWRKPPLSTVDPSEGLGQEVADAIAGSQGEAGKSIEVLGVADCPSCGRLIGKDVNRGARLWCRSCRAEKVVG